MRIIMVTSKLNFVTGGGSVLDLDLTARTFQHLGHQVNFLTVYSASNDVPADVPYGIFTEQIKASSFLKVQWDFYKLLKKYSARTDIFYIESHAFLYGAGLYRWLGGLVPVVAFFNRELTCWPEDISVFLTSPQVKQKFHVLIALKKKIRQLVEKYLLMPVANGIDFITYTNPILKQEYEKFGFHTDRNMITGDPFDFEKMMRENSISETSYQARNKKQGPLTLFYSSRMAPGKGFDLLLAAFAKVKNKQAFKLVLGGSGPEEPLIRQAVKDLGLLDYVEMPGWVPREELFNSLKQADIFIQARWRTDMTSTSLLFAMAFGLPCILPGGGGLEWVGKGAGLYFKDGDPEDLARKIEQLGNDFNLRAILSHNCYKRLKDDEIYYQRVLPALVEIMGRLVDKSSGQIG